MSRCLLKVSTIFCGTVQWLHWLQILGMAKLFAHPFAVSSIVNLLLFSKMSNYVTGFGDKSPDSEM